MIELQDPFEGPDGPRLRRIRDALAPLGDLAGLFRDMCVIEAGRDQFAAAPAVVMHDLRELMSALRDVLDPLEAAPRRDPLPSNRDLRGDLARFLAEHSISAEDDVLDDLEKKLAPRTGEADQIRHIGTMLELDADLVGRWIRLKPVKRAHRQGLNVAAAGPDYRATFSDALEVLDAVTQAWTRQWPQIDALIQQAALSPTPNLGLARRLRVAVPTIPPVQDAMFDQLDASWTAFLRKAGVISDPPHAVRVDEQAYAVPWPAGRFLAAAAAINPAEVAAVIEQLAPTDNPPALVHVARAAAAMPFDSATRALPWLARAIEATDLPLYGRDVVDAIAAHPIDHPNVVALATAALRPRPAGLYGSTCIVDPDAHAHVAAAVASGPDPEAAALRLAALLADPLVGDTNGGKSSQVTGSWAPDLTLDPAAPQRDPRATIAAATLYAAARVTDLRAALALLDSVPQPLRARMRLELLRRRLQADVAAELAALELVATADVWSHAVDREWAMLAKAAGEIFEDEACHAVAGAIGIESNEAPQVPQPTPDGLDSYRTAAWPLRWLARAVAVAGMLPETWQASIDAATPAGFDPTVVRRVVISAYQPAGIVEDPTTIPFGQLIDTALTRLRAAADDPTTPQPDTRMPTPPGGVADLADGIRNDLAIAATADPAGASTTLMALRPLPARAARGAIAGLHQAARRGVDIPWAAVADYAQQVLADGPLDQWIDAVHGVDGDRAAADHVDLVRQLADVLADATRRVTEPPSEGPAGTAVDARVIDALRNMLRIDDQRATTRDAWTPRPDVPPRAVPTIVVDALIRGLPDDLPQRRSLLEAMIGAAGEHEHVRIALAYRLADLADADPEWVSQNIDRLFGSRPDGSPDSWDPAFAAHLAGPNLSALALPDALPWYRAAGNVLDGDDADEPDARGSEVVAKLVRAELEGAIDVDDPAIVQLLARGGGLPAAVIGEAAAALREAETVDEPAARRARELIDAGAAAAGSADEATANAAAAMAGVLAGQEIVAALGVGWVMRRLGMALSRRVPPYGPWHVARLVAAEAAAGRAGAGDLCVALVRALGPRELDMVGDLLASAAGAAGADEGWAAELKNALAVRLGPTRVTEAAATPLPPLSSAPGGTAP